MLWTLIFLVVIVLAILKFTHLVVTKPGAKARAGLGLKGIGFHIEVEGEDPRKESPD